MNSTNEKLDAIEEVLQQVVIAVNKLEKRNIANLDVRIPDYSNQLEEISQKLDGIKKGSEEVDLRTLSAQLARIPFAQQTKKEYRFLLFPETNQGHYYKIVFGRLFPWGMLFVIISFLFSLGQKALEVWKIKEYNNQADQYVKAWLYLQKHTESKTTKKRMADAWQKANQ